MNIESKARAGFTSIMLRGGRMTKWKGQVASYAPQVGHLQSVSVVAMAAALAFGGALAVPQEAVAQDVDVVIDLAPPFDSVKHVNSGTGALNITATVPVEGALTGIEAKNESTATDINLVATDVTANADGIVVTNLGNGLSNVTTTGTVTGATGDGIDVTSSGNGLNVNVTNVTGKITGIDAKNNGSGVTTIIASGLVKGEVSFGVDVAATENSGGIDISVVDVTAGFVGIRASSEGKGDIDIAASGLIFVPTVSDTATTGVDARLVVFVPAVGSDPVLPNGDIIVDVADVIAGRGIITRNNGTGGSTITSTDTSKITATYGNGIDVFQVGAGSDITIDVNDVTATNIAVAATNGVGTGDLTITVNDVETKGGAGAVPGTSALMAINNGVGNLLLTANSKVDGFAGGISASNSSTAANIAIVTQAVTAGGTGISLQNQGGGFSTISSDGPIDATTGDGIYAYNDASANNLTVDAAAVSGGANGIDVLNDGTGFTLIKSSGLVTGLGGQGILVASSGTDLTIEAADVSGTLDAIEATNSGTGNTFVTLTGTATGGTTGNGINVTNAASAKNLTINATKLAPAADANGVVEATISGGVNGILVVNNGVGGSTSVTALGKTVGANGDGIKVTNEVDTLDLTVSAGTVEGGDYGIVAYNKGTGSTSITATGDVTGTNNVGIVALNGTLANDLTIVANGDVTGGDSGIVVANDGTGSTSITATGDVTGTDGSGIVASNEQSAKDLTINATKLAVADEYGVVAATISGGVDGIVVINNGVGGSTYVAALGKTVGATGDGIRVINEVDALDLTIKAGTVEGAVNGILAYHNDGTSSTTITATGSISITTTGPVVGKAGVGISAKNALATSGNLTVDAAAVSGGTIGIDALNNGTGFTLIKSTGLVTGLGGQGILVASSGTDLTIEAADVSGTLDAIEATNSGTGNTFLTLTGTATGGATGNGINVTNAASAKNLTINATKLAPAADANGVVAATISGGVNGILVVNKGVGGSTSVTALGKTVGATGDGIKVTNEVDTLDLTILAGTVEGNFDGIDANNYGKGSTKVTATGDVTGTNGTGIYAYNDEFATDLTIVANGNVKGGFDGIEVVNNGTGLTSITATGDVTGAAGNGIDVTNAASAKNLTINATKLAVAGAATISGGVNGILVVNNGVGGSTSVTALGKTVGAAGDGIDVTNEVGTLDLTISAGTVEGDDDGIDADNKGTGSTSITATGDVTGTNGDGINALNGASANELAIVANGDVTGDDDGIEVVNFGAGSTTVTAAGDVTGINNVGIAALNGTLANDLTIVANGDVTGGDFGVGVANIGTGSTSITATGNVTGTDNNGIAALNGTLTDDLTIVANGNVTGGFDGIEVVNNGTGLTSITATGDVTGTDGNGIDVTNAASAKNLTINATKLAVAGAATISGGVNGILVVNNGVGGSTSVTALGKTVGANGDGVSVENAANTGNVNVAVNNVEGGVNGIQVTNNGTGSATVAATGAIIGKAGNGIAVRNSATATTLAVTAKDVSGTSNAILTDNQGAGPSVVSVTGKIIGGTGVGIATSSKAATLTTINLAATAEVSATSGNAITNNLGDSILNVAKGTVINGTIRLGDGSDTANFLMDTTEAFATITALDGGDNISVADGFIDVLNLNGAGTYDLVGARITNWETINLNAGTLRFSDALITSGTFNINSTATLDGSNNLVATTNVNVATGGTLRAGNAAGNANMRVVGNLTNGGVVNLTAATAKAGDNLSVSGNFTGAGGRTTVDTVVNGDNSPTDLLVVGGNVNGTSLIAVNNVGGVGGVTSGDGIKLVQVGGTSNADALALVGGDLQVGGFRYELFLGGVVDPNDQDWYLRTAGLADIAAEVIASARLADDISMTFLGTLHERVGEEEHLAKRGYQSGGIRGLWGRFVGKGFRERLASPDLGQVRSTGSITGMQLGLDVVRKIDSGNMTIAGAYAGYVDGSSNDRNIFQGISRRTGSSEANGFVAGLYATHYGSTGWYANAVLQGSFLDAAANARNGTTLKTDGRTFLGSLEMGKALKLGGRMAFEPQVQVIYGNNKFDGAVDSAGFLNEVAIEDSIIGRAGFRLKTTKDEKYNADGGLFSGYLKANLWHNFLGADVSLASAGQAVGKFEPKKTWVDVGLGATLTVAKQTEIFFDADVEFGIDQKTTAGTGKVGLRFNW